MMMRRLTWGLMLLLFAAGQPIQAQEWPVAQPEAKAGSRWWWLGSAVDEKNLSWNIGEYAAHGIGALEITPLYGVQGNEKNNIPFLSDRWMEMLRYCMQEGKKHGVEIDMNCGTGWPFGSPLVPIEEAACKLVVVDTIVNERQLADLDISAPEKERPYSTLQVVMAFSENVPKYALNKVTKVANVTKSVFDGHLRLRKVEKGTWRIIALYAGRTRQKVKRAAPGGEGWVIDHFDSTAVAHYLQRFEDAFERTHTPYPHTFFNDSYEVYHADWTPTLLTEFEKRRGYKLEYRLRQFIDGDPQVMSDYRETLSDLLLENFTNQWVAWCHRHGSKVRNQAHGSPANLIDVYAAVDIPEIEGYGLTDFGIKGLRTDPGMTRKNFSDLSMLKYAPSASHILGKRLTSSETFTWLTEHFRTSLSQMKPDMDLMFCAGVNHMFFHGTCYSPKDDPWPGWRFYASIDMSPTNTIWRDAPNFMKYIERCQSFMQWGQPDNDFLVYLPVRDMWANNTDTRLMQFDIHEMDRKAPEFIKAILTIDSLGFDCDYISDQYLLTTSYENGRLLTAAGTPYKGLVIPGDCTMPKEVKAHIETLRKKGAAIIYGLNGSEMAKATQPERMKTELGLKLIRRKNDKGYHYFIANLTPDEIDKNVKLTVDFEDAMWFDPMTGNRYAVEKNQGLVRVALHSGESRILQTFSKAEPACASVDIQPRRPVGMPIVLDKGWTLALERNESMGIPEERSYPIDQLKSWEKIDDFSRTYIGTGTYSCTFTLSKKDLKASDWFQIDLGDVRESAVVTINGQQIGCAWAVPYLLTFPSSVLKKGKNDISIAVTNLAANRIAQLDREGVKWRKFEEINVVDIDYHHTTYDHWTPMPSGLNSSVRLYPVSR